MSEGNDYQTLARRYGFAPRPESAMRLTQLVARQDGDVDDIVRVIEKDPSLRERLLRVANPDAESPAEYYIETVDEALMRNGLGCVLVLAMSTPLALALVKAFQTMLAVNLENVNPSSTVPLEGDHLLGTIVFDGKVSGAVQLRTSLDSARTIAASILGVEPEEVKDMDEARDVAGELLNIMTGNFKSNLCDAGLECRLHPPDVKVTNDYSVPGGRGGGVENLAFKSDKLQIFVTVSANPWSDD